MENQETAASPFAQEMTTLQRWRWRVSIWFVRLRRKLPYLVWYGDELDCRVTWLEDRLPASRDPDEAFMAFFSGPLRDLEKAIHNVGVSFDTGLGMGGRDWEWDWSLQGPVSVTFVSRATKPELRRARPEPRLIVSNDAA